MQPITRYRIAVALIAVIALSNFIRRKSLESDIQTELDNLYTGQVTILVVDDQTHEPLNPAVTLPGISRKDVRWPRCITVSGIPLSSSSPLTPPAEVQPFPNYPVSSLIRWTSPFPITVTLEAEGHLPQAIQLDESSSPNQTIKLKRAPNTPQSPSPATPTPSLPKQGQRPANQ